MTPHDAPDPAALIDAYLEGDATPADVAALDRWLDADPANPVAFSARAELHARLTRVYRPVNAELRTHPVEPAITFKPNPRSIRAKVRAPGIGNLKFAIFNSPFASAAAALLLAAAAVAIYLIALNSKPETRNSNRSAPVATIIDSTGGTLVVGDRVASPGDEIATGDLSLDAGFADFRLTNGVGVTLHGMTRLTVHDTASATLRRGTASFDCPHAVAGYTVHLPGGARVVDLGTAFTIRVAGDGSAFVEVTEGAVELTAAGRTERINADQAGLVDRSSSTPALTVGERPVIRSDRAMADLAQSLDPSSLVLALDGGDGQAAPAADRFGRPDRAARFDGNGRIDLHRAWPAGPYTAAAWVRPDAFGEYAYVIGVQNSGYNPGRFLRLAGDRPQFTHVVANKAQPDGIFAAFGPAIPADRWTHLAATFRATDELSGGLTLYVNGKPVDAITVAGDSSATEERPNLTIGARPDRSPTQFGFVGAIDDAVVVARAMSDQEIERLYEAGRPGPLDDQPAPAGE